MIRTNNHHYRGYNNYSHSGSHNDLQDNFMNLCDDLTKNAKRSGCKNGKEFLKRSYSEGKITLEEKELGCELLKLRNSKAHGLAGYVGISPNGFNKARDVFKKAKGESTESDFRCRGNSRSFAKTAERRSEVDGEVYRFNFFSKDTSSNGFIINVIQAPYWNFVLQYARTFNVYSSEKGNTIYTNRMVRSPEEAVKVINNFVNYYSAVLDELKR